MFMLGTLFVDDTPYKSLFNGSFNAIYVETFEKSGRNDNYLLGIVLPYMETLHFLEFNVPTFVQDNPFGRNIKHMIHYTKHYLKVVLVVVIRHIVQM
jgi:hypothetical protein